MRLKEWSDVISLLCLSLAVILAKVVYSSVPFPVFVVICGIASWWLYITIKGHYADNKGSNKVADKKKARQADDAAKSLIAELNEEDKAKGSNTKRQNKKGKDKAKAGSKTPNTRNGESNRRQEKSKGGTNMENVEDDDDDDAFLDRAARVATMASRKKRN